MFRKIANMAQFYTETFLYAVKALKINKVRAFLSLIGITIGIFSIITVFSVLDSMKSSIRKNIESLGNNIVYIQKWPWEFSNDYPWWKYLNRPLVSVHESEVIAEKSTKASSVVFTASTFKNVNYYKKQVSNVLVNIASYDYDKVRNFEVEKGHYFTPFDAKSGVRKVIIGTTVASILFNNEYPIGKDISIMGLKFMVIGVFKREGNSMSGESMDNSVLIPLNCARNIFDLRNEMMNPSIMVRAYDNVSLDELTAELRIIMRSLRRIRPVEEDNFALNKASLITQGFEDVFRIIDTAGLIIGGFSILVGGFGIANIMFVSVKERTKQIGIQKAIGAKNNFILFQFLNEAVLLSLIGGIVGLICVFFAVIYGQQLIDMELSLSFQNILMGIFISVVIGLISGFAPAWVAAKMNPVDAINSNF